MRASCTFTVAQTAPVPFDTGIETGLPTGILRMEKALEGPGVIGRCVTQFNHAFDAARGTGTYVALESFEGTLAGLGGTMIFLHSASTTGTDRTDQIGRIVPGSGTGGLSGITGSVSLVIDADDTHHFVFDYELRRSRPRG